MEKLFNNMIYIKPQLDKVGKKASEFINWLCDNKRNHNLEKYKDQDMIRIDSNHGSGGHIYMDEQLKDKLNEFLEE